MEITQLHYFKLVSKHESFTKAAAELHITQSALSRSIAQLEEEIGLQLLERRRGGRTTLNQNGRFFLRHVGSILNSLENTVSAMKEMTGLEQGIIHVALDEVVFLKHLFFAFMRDHPNVRLSCRLQSHEQIKSCLDDGTLNFAVCKEPIPGADLIWQPLFRDRLTVLFPPNHPLAGRKSVYLDELSQEHFIATNLGYDMEGEIYKLCSLVGFEPYVVYEGGGEDLCGRLVAQGIGIMLAPYSVSMGTRLLGVDAVPLGEVPLADDFAEGDIGIVAKRGQFQSDAALELYDRIVDFYHSLPAPPSGRP